MREAREKGKANIVPTPYFLSAFFGELGSTLLMNHEKGIITCCFWVFCLAAFSQNQPHLSFAEKEDLKGYEFIGDIDYLLVREADNCICTAFNWKVYLYGKPFGNTYIFKICVKGEKSNSDKSIYTLVKMGISVLDMENLIITITLYTQMLIFQTINTKLKYWMTAVTNIQYI